MLSDKAAKPEKNHFRNKFTIYAIVGTAVLLVSCTSAIPPASPNKISGDLGQTKFFFDGEDFESRTANIARPAVKGYQKTVPAQRLKTGWSNDALAQELVAHKRAIALARSSEIAAKRYANEAETLRVASQKASGKAAHADSSSRIEQQRAASLQKKADEKSRFARQARLRAARLKQKADIETRLAQSNMEQAKAAKVQARRVSLQARSERDRAKRLGSRAQQESRLGAGKLKTRNQAYQQASALEKRARQRSMNLRNRLGKDQAARKKALKVAQAAWMKADRLSKELDNHKNSLARSESHELALKTNH